MISGVLVVTAGYDNKILFWEPGRGRAYRAVKHNESQVNDLKVTISREFVAAAGNSNISFYETDSRNGNAVISFQGHSGNVNEIGFNNTGTWMYSCSDDKTVKIWDIRAYGAQKEFVLSAQGLGGVLHPNQSEIIVGCSDASIRVIDLVGDRISTNLEKPVKRKFNDLIRSVAISPSGNNVTSIGREGAVYNLQIDNNDASTIHHTSQFIAHKDHIVTRCLYSKNGEYLATASSDSTIKIWSTDEWNLVHTLEAHDKWVWDIRFSNDGKYLLSGSSDTTSILWDLTIGLKVCRYKGHKGAISAVELDDNFPTPVEDDDLIPFSII
jgi:G protein beta subunit-like protein